MSTATATSNALVSLIQKGRVALREGKSLTEVAVAMADPIQVEHVRTTEVVPFPALPKPLVITPEAKRALLDLPKVFGKVILDKRRPLSSEEITNLRKEQEVLRQIEALMKGRDDAIKEYIRTHVDADAEAAGIAVDRDVVRGGHVVVEATPRDPKGHYLLAEKGKPTVVPIPGTNETYSLEYREGKDTPSIDPNALEDLLESGEISREDYLSLTVEKRVFDEAKAARAFNAKPERLTILTKILHRTVTPPSTALNIRKVK